MNATDVPKDLLNGTVGTSKAGEPRCETLQFVFSFLIIGSICILGLIGNTLSLVVLLKIKVGFFFQKEKCGYYLE